MKVIIVGAGEVGYHVAERLSAEKHDVVVIDLDSERLEYVQSHLDVGVMEGSGSSPEILRRAGAADARMLLAVTSQDEVNLVSCMTMRDQEDMLRVARVSNPDFYVGSALPHPELFGIDLMINPERELALETLRLLKSGAGSEIAIFAGGSVQMIGLDVLPEAPAAGQRLIEIAEMAEAPMLTAAIQRDGKTIIPTGVTRIYGGDHVYVVTTPDAVPEVLSLCGHTYAPLTRVMIAGGSYEAFYLAGLLEQEDVEATILVKDRDKAHDFAERLDKSLVLNGDATDLELLELEGVGGVDAFIALTDEDETNILSSLVARDAGARKVITLVNKVDYLPLARRIGLDAAVSPRLSAADAILRYVRPGSVTHVTSLKDSDAEALSFFVSPGAHVAGRQLKDVDLPDGAIVTAIVRGRDVIVPRGSNVLEPGDTAVLMVLPGALRSVSRLFST